MDTHSPFPGMDPFLEYPVRWHGVHTRLIVAIAGVPLDLHSIVESVYARGHYADSINYLGEMPQPRLKLPDQAWA